MKRNGAALYFESQEPEKYHDYTHVSFKVTGWQQKCQITKDHVQAMLNDFFLIMISNFVRHVKKGAKQCNI